MDFQNYLQNLNNNLELGSERSHYYALQTLIDSALIGINAIVEEKGNQAGIPDFTVRRNGDLIGYIEAKKLGSDLNKIQESEQLKRYFDSAIAQNLILTNFLEFRLFRDGKLYIYGGLGTLENQQIVLYRDFQRATNLINEFVNYQEKSINNYLDLAQQMAIYTKSVKYALEEGLKREDESGELTKLKTVFTDLLLPDLDNQTFADMYAQTLAYGLFTARFYHAQNSSLSNREIFFNRQNISLYLSNKIPFLQGLFNTVIKTDIVSQIDWTIDNLIELFASVDMNNILENFGQEIGRDDPVIHFYETFLSAYSQDLRKTRGVYYTPSAVVNFIVKAVNDILDQDFNLQDGLSNRDVNILDPATGTGTFLYQVIKQICENYSQYSPQKWQHNWQQYLSDRKVLSRLFGFELLMTPYTIAHLKLQLLLENLGYHLAENEKLNIFLTNALDEGIKKSESLLAEYITKEANESAKVKKETPILVILGNPPYAGHSANKNSWINQFLENYCQVDGLPLNEKNSKWLQDDYVKFIRFAQYQIDKNGLGILAFITNHGYLDNPTFRGMRQSLINSFNRLFIVNLHGNIKKKEICPDGSKDENVFDIQQGVSILIAIKDIPSEHLKFLRLFNPNYKLPEKGIYYYDLWGNREAKYKLLNQLTLKTIEWKKLKSVSPFYLFVPQDEVLKEEYEQYWKITDIMSEYSLGCLTKRDKLVINYTFDEVLKNISEFIDKNKTDEEAVSLFDLPLTDKDKWNANIARKSISKKEIKNYVKLEIFRPFDLRYIFYHNLFVARLNTRIMQQFLLTNYGIVLGRQGGATGSENWDVLFVTETLIDQNIFRRGGGTVFPLYIYPNKENGQDNLDTEKQANFSPEFLTAITTKLGYTPTPEKFFYYIYAVLHSPVYREIYSEFLKIDFPRIPLTSNNELFTQLANQGEILVNLHLMRKLPDVTITKNETPATVNLPLFNEQTKGVIHYQGDGVNKIEQIAYNSTKKRIALNTNCYFVGITQEVWEFKIGGYQVLDKWLKDRKKAKRNLSSEDITHYQKIIVILDETIKIMGEIDKIIAKFPIT